ncbi:helix-turn-helix domain-containing protein [Roseateles sp. NT4]|uniref:helix-turn-helix domain-containing protein n=1 Tax=Roseateles sp. NT4 TaxID=3453715 RepID=UPI003EEC5328
MEHVDESLLRQAPGIPADGRIALAPQRLTAHRLRLGLSQEALAEYCFDRRLCVSIASIKRAESGKSILYRTARHLATAYEIPLESLVSNLPRSPEEMAGGLTIGLAGTSSVVDVSMSDDEPTSRSVVVLALPPAAVLTPDEIHHRPEFRRRVAQRHVALRQLELLRAEVHLCGERVVELLREGLHRLGGGTGVGHVSLLKLVGSIGDRRALHRGGGTACDERDADGLDPCKHDGPSSVHFRIRPGITSGSAQVALDRAGHQRRGFGPLMSIWQRLGRVTNVSPRLGAGQASIEATTAETSGVRHRLISRGSRHTRFNKPLGSARAI